MKRILFLSLLLAVTLSVNAQAQSFSAQENKELADSIDQFIALKHPLVDPFLFRYKGKEMSVRRSAAEKRSGSCYAYFTIHPPVGCVGDTFEIRTVFVDGLGPWHVVYTPGGITTPVFYHVATGPFQFSASATDANGCNVGFSGITAEVNPTPSLSISRMGEPCYDVFIANTNGCQTDITWSNGDAGPGGDYSNYPGSVAIATIEALGCTNSDTTVLNPPCAVIDTVYDHMIVYDTIGCDSMNGGGGGTPPTPNFDFSSDSQECGPDTVYFYDASSGNPTSWNWVFNGGTPANSTEQNPVVVYKHKGDFTVRLSVGNSAGVSEFLQAPSIIHIKGEAPEVTASTSKTVIQAGQYVELSASVSQWGNYGYEWDHAGTLDNNAHQNPYAWPTETTTYTVKVTDVLTGCVGYASVKVIVLGTTANQEVDPNLFEVISALGSNEIRIKSTLKDYHAAIFDVSGRIVKSEKSHDVETIISTDNLAPGQYFLNIILGNKGYVKPITVIN